MTRIEHHQISRFKSIDEMDVNLGGLTVITGNNNSGKTSLLQSIDLAFNPKNIRSYEENAEYLISTSANKQQSTIKSEYTDRPWGQMTLEDLNSEDKVYDCEVSLRRPTERETISLVFDLFENLISLNEDYPMPTEVLEGEYAADDEEKVKTRVTDITRDVVGSLSPEEILDSGIGDKLVIMDSGGESFRYIYLGKKFDKLRTDLVESGVERLVSEHDELSYQSLTDYETSQLERFFNRMLAPRFGRQRFIGDVPDNLGGVTFVDKPKASLEDINLDVGDAAVRTQKIEKYLKENNVIEGLEDFSFDELVFDQGDDPYSVPYDFMGDGFKTIVGVLWHVFAEGNEGDVILLEEPESHMHPEYVIDMVKEILRLCMTRGLQIIVTTHNADFITSFFSSFISEEEVEYLKNNFRLIQMKNGIDDGSDFGYETAKDRVENLNLDLRGI